MKEAQTPKTTLPKYSAYKDSGVEWLGEIPEGWELRRMGAYFNERRTKVSDKDFEPLSVTKNGIVPQLDNAAKSNDGDNRKLVKTGDFVINSRSDRKGSSGISPLDGSVSLINIVMKPKGIDSAYCNYLLKGQAFVEENYRIGHGIVADLWTTRYDEMKNIIISIPPQKEQTAIANFLDDKTTKIDRAIAQKEKMIALLKERKQIIIQNAVTGKLKMDNGQWIMRPKSEMKHSGVEWIGEIPEHWEVVANRSLFKETKLPGREGLSLLSVSIHSAVSTEELSDEENIRGLIRIEDKTNYKHVAVNDIVFNMMRAWQGAIGAVKVEGMVSPAYIVARPNDKILAAFFEYQYRSDDFIQQMNRNSKGITDFRKRLYWDEFKQLQTVLPPKSEQLEIINYIESQSAKIDKAISLQQTQIEKLKAYKATLIDSAVTGKIKING